MHDHPTATWPHTTGGYLLAAGILGVRMDLALIRPRLLEQAVPAYRKQLVAVDTIC